MDKKVWIAYGRGFYTGKEADKTAGYIDAHKSATSHFKRVNGVGPTVIIVNPDFENDPEVKFLVDTYNLVLFTDPDASNYMLLTTVPELMQDTQVELDEALLDLRTKLYQEVENEPA